MYYYHNSFLFVSYCWQSFCTMIIVLYWQVLYPLWWISGIIIIIIIIIIAKVKYEQKDISSSTETKFLGLIIDQTLSWNQHIDQIATKLCSACYALGNLKHIVPQSRLRTIYYAYISQDRDRWWALVSTVINHRVPKMQGISWLAAEPVSFSRRTLLHGVSK